MVTRGRGSSFRGRGPRGRGRGGRGRPYGRFGPTRRFDTARLQDEDEDDDEDDSKSQASADSQLDDELIDVDSDGDEEEGEGEFTSHKPYMALLQSFSEGVPNAKRRKLDQAKVGAPVASTPVSQAHPQDSASGSDVDEAEMENEGDEENPEDSAAEDSDDDENSADPFDTHFAYPDEQSSAQAIEAMKKGTWVSKRAMLNSFRATISIPVTERSFTPPILPETLDSMNLKQKLRDGISKKLNHLSVAQQAVASVMFDYQDVLYCDRTIQSSDGLRQLTCIHALNHVFKTRDRVLKNNYKLAKDGNDTDLELRDQGFTRPKVLFLLPTRNSCARMISVIRDLCKPDQEENRKRFDESYITKDSNFGDDRPQDFRDLFEGNDDDMFRIGMKFTRKTVKYFSQFYNSDILFASPLGLRMAIGSEEEKKKPDFDFLSSIEVVIMDQADALLMQNWEHVEYIFEHMNLQPKDAHDCDFSRVRNWYLEDWAKYFRQTIVLSAFNSPELAELQRSYCHNWAGKVRLQPEYSGLLQELGLKTRQTFSRFQANTIEKDPDARFEYFTSAIVPSIVKRAKDANGTLIFVPSYLDFVRVRNYFATSGAVSSISFGAISEYTDIPESSRARSHFVNGRHRVLLYSERAHHFRRYQIKGVQRVIFYGLPDNPIFYREIAGDYLRKSEQDMLIESGRGSVRVIFSRYDAMKLERIVGSKRVGKMIQDRGDTFDFV